MASEIRVNKINSQTGVGTITLSPTGVDISGITTAATLKVGTGVTVSSDGDIFATGITTVSGNVKVGTGITLSPDGNVFTTGVSTFSGAVTIDDGLNVGGSLSIPDMMHHAGDTNTQIRFPAADTISMETAGSERLRINSDGDVGIGLDNPDDFYSKELVIKAASEGGITIRNTNSGDWNYIMFASGDSGNARYDSYIGVDHGNNKVRISTNETSSARNVELRSDGDFHISNGNLVFDTNGKGIDFSANTSDSAGVASELLDDYEEGTFTPNIQGTGSNNSKTYSYQLGKYTKIGNIVHCEFRITWSGYSGNDTGSAIVNGFPFVIDNNIATGAIVGALATNNCNYPGSNTVATAGWEASNGQQYVFPLVSYDNSSWQNPDANSFWGGSANVRGSVTYRVS